MVRRRGSPYLRCRTAHAAGRARAAAGCNACDLDGRATQTGFGRGRQKAVINLEQMRRLMDDLQKIAER
ncbi:hypothetical protein BH23ACI1_BH23ACI1_07900 [soil metagenome]